MSETQKYLRERWNNNLRELYLKICIAFESGNSLTELGLDTTDTGRFDLRGFGAPKELAQHTSNKGNQFEYVKSSIKIRKQNFSDFDFSFADFEQCSFVKCNFSNSIFYKSRLRECDFHSCTLSDSEFESTDLGGCVIDKDLFDFNGSRSKIEKVLFSNSNLSDVIVRKMNIKDCTISASKTGKLIFDKCFIDGLKINDESKNLFFLNNKALENIDFDNASVEGMQYKGIEEEQNQTLVAHGIQQLQ